MITPYFFYQDDFKKHFELFKNSSAIKKLYKKGTYLWQPGIKYEKIHYIISGIAMHFACHESGQKRIISFHGPHTVFPMYRNLDFKIELSLY